MKCLTPEKTLTGDCEFLAANLYARSMFGESALANLSIEVGSNGFVQGKLLSSIFGSKSYIRRLIIKNYFRSHQNTRKEPGNGNQSW